ncbi:MAG: sulfatase-like hydrolase/transferase [Bacilli bacterium]|nr:sulfatase-like hydrolase/transferase [Bacilli bacterium]
MKKLIFGYGLSFILSFLLFLYEPFALYVTNLDEFTFDIYDIFPTIILSFLGCFLFFCLVFTILYRFVKNKKIYDIVFLVIALIFLGLFLQGNFFNIELPWIDGSKVIWSKYVIPNIVSITLWLVIIAIGIFLPKKIGFDNIYKLTVYACIFVSLILSMAIIGNIVVMKNSLFQKKYVLSTTENYQVASTNRNFIILMLDAVDAVMFDEIMQKNKHENVFDDFTFYKDTTSTYIYTRDSIPFILTNKWNKNKTSFSDYSNKAYSNSYLFKTLKDNNYAINLYTNDLIWEDEGYKVTANLKNTNKSIDSFIYLREQKKYILFKYLPFPLKRLSKIETIRFKNKVVYNNEGLYDWNDIIAYDEFRKGKLNTTDTNMFKFIHIEGAHVPFDLNNKVENIGANNGTYYDKLESSILIIDAFLKQLKESNVYDNSNIIIMADHGYALGNGYEGRQNPILFIKGINEHHGLERSDIPVSYTDLKSVYFDLLNEKQSSELFADVDPNRDRKMLLYVYGNESHMVEVVQQGEAWNEKTIKSTGNIYDLKK